MLKYRDLILALSKITVVAKMAYESYAIFATIIFHHMT